MTQHVHVYNDLICAWRVQGHKSYVYNSAYLGVCSFLHWHAPCPCRKAQSSENRLNCEGLQRIKSFNASAWTFAAWTFAARWVIKHCLHFIMEGAFSRAHWSGPGTKTRCRWLRHCVTWAQDFFSRFKWCVPDVAATNYSTWNCHQL